MAGLLKKHLDLYSDQKWKKAHVISFNELWLNLSDTLSLKIFGLTEEYLIFRCDRNNKSGGVGLIVHKKIKTFQFQLNGTDLDIVSVRVFTPNPFNIISVYRPQWYMYQDFLTIFCLF